MSGVVMSGCTTGSICLTVHGGQPAHNVTNFTDLSPGANFVTVEAGHSDVNTAYVLANLGLGRGGGGGRPPPPRGEPHHSPPHLGPKGGSAPGDPPPRAKTGGGGRQASRKTPKKKRLFFRAPRPRVAV